MVGGSRLSGARFVTVCTVLSFVLLASVPHVLAQTSIAERRVQLEAELRRIESLIEQQRVYLNEKQQERTSLERDIAILDSQIESAQLSIRYRDLEIQALTTEIGNQTDAIQSLDEKMERSQESLAQLIRRTRAIDDTSLVELMLQGSISDFFADIDNYEVLQTSLTSSFDEIIAVKEDLSVRREVLEVDKEEEESLRQLQVLERQEIEAREAEKQELLAVTKGQEEAYQELIAGQEKTAAQIRAALFSLRDSADISFGQAYELAKAASAATGVRPAFLLGIIKNESDLGKNVGQCLLTNSPNKGDGVGKNTGRAFSGVMKATRDVDPFMRITAELGIDPFSQPVSCPQSIGYGGAMGPAQFIPSTWVLYEDKVAAATGTNPPNPWDPRTAFTASAFLLKDNGADGGTREAERLAAIRYYAGWAGASNPAFASYGTRVLNFADEFQAQIDILEGR